MRRCIKPTILILCLTALVAVAATETNIDYMQVAEDIDIMARIIDKTLERKFPDEYKVSSMSGFRGCQGIYLKDYGAIFMTNVGFPVAEQAEEVQEETKPDDLWQQTKYELKGLEAPGISYANIGGNYASKKVEQLKEELLKLIGTYAPNIRRLSSQENVVIAVRGKPGIGAQPFGMMRFTIVTLDESVKGDTTLIVKVNRESIMAYKDGRLDFASLMKQAEVTQY